MYVPSIKGLYLKEPLETGFIATRAQDGFTIYEISGLVNAGLVPSEHVVKYYVKKNGKDYGYLLKGEHPVERLKKSGVI